MLVHLKPIPYTEYLAMKLASLSAAKWIANEMQCLKAM